MSNNNEGYETVSGEVTKLSDLTGPIEGLYLGVEELTHSTGYLIQLEHERIILAGGSSLTRAMKKIDVQTQVRITYEGEGISDYGNKFHKCKVERKKAKS